MYRQRPRRCSRFIPEIARCQSCSRMCYALLRAASAAAAGWKRAQTRGATRRGGRPARSADPRRHRAPGTSRSVTAQGRVARASHEQ